MPIRKKEIQCCQTGKDTDTPNIAWDVKYVYTW